MRTELSTEPLSHEPNRIARSPAPPGAGVAPWTLPPALRPARDEGPIWSGQLPISSGWIDLLQSYAVLDDVVRELQLYVTPVEPRDSDALRGFGIKDAVLPGTYRLEVDSLGQRFTLTAH